MKTELAGKTVLVTGASSGIGRACARRFAQEGARLLLCARRRDALEAIEGELAREFRVPVLSRVVDVTRRADVEELFRELPSDWSPPDVLVNNAGLALGFEYVREGDPDDWETMIDTNVKGLLHFTRQVLLATSATPERRLDIINIGSIAGVQPYPNGAVYCATKAAVKVFSDALRMEVADRPVRVTNVQPGMVETGFSITRFHGDEARAKQVYRGITPMSGDDIADIVVYAASAPEHVQICEVTVTATHQASSLIVHRNA